MKNLHWVILAPVILFAIVVSVRFLACGPDRKVVRVAKPVAKIIADDIVKNGIPESLKDIEGLPYELEGCKRSEVFEDIDENKVSKDKAYLEVIEEKCIFKKNDKVYNIDIWFVQNFIHLNRSHGELRLFNQEKSTGIKYSFKYSKEKNKLFLKKTSYDNPLVYDHKSTGVCSQFRP